MHLQAPNFIGFVCCLVVGRWRAVGLSAFSLKQLFETQTLMRQMGVNQNIQIFAGCKIKTMSGKDVKSYKTADKRDNLSVFGII